MRHRELAIARTFTVRSNYKGAGNVPQIGIRYVILDGGAGKRTKHTVVEHIKS